MICLLSHHALMPKRYEMAQMDNLDPVGCPCGFARRAFASAENNTATLHIVDIQSDSKTHYHKKLTEIYLVLEGQGEIELDGERFPVRPMSAIMIKPGCRHRAIGKMKIMNVPIPAFDPEDEWFDEENETH
ncbi:cupin domain-containing protein [bacterium]|jgi:mannose-6-phosphate isomerase-like protein (cupin superfamily)|nr:cupin domain-containing protein [Verrucomicrobiota bacterium]MDC0262490.1 cupin domain-containing protein [bacterium]